MFLSLRYCCLKSLERKDAAHITGSANSVDLRKMNRINVFALPNLLTAFLWIWITIDTFANLDILVSIQNEMKTLGTGGITTKPAIGSST